tara:strand:- start:749 stop:1057 length:309 start_codon:yes stop_codon:yes gene_type:complete
MSESDRPYSVRVDVRLTEAEREYLTQEAIKRDMSRQDMMRKLLLSDIDAVDPVKDYKPVVVSNGRDAIDRAMTAVMRQYNCVPASKLEGIICTVICALAAEG